LRVILVARGFQQRRKGGSRVFRDPNDEGRLWVLFDWDDEGYGSLMSDPEVPAIFQEAGLQGRPEKAELVREHDA
jgi:hypothetical protein